MAPHAMLTALLLVGAIASASSASASASAPAPASLSPSTDQSSLSDVVATIARYWVGKADTQSIVPSLLSLATADDEDYHSDRGVLSLRRSLQDSDFDELNELLRVITIQAPDTTVKQKILWNDLNLDLKNIRCYDISVEDVRVSFEEINNQMITVPIDIVGLDMWCELDWRYSWGIFSGSGSAQMYTNNNSVRTVLKFTSKDFALHAPNGSGVESCESRILITDINIQGNFVAQVVNFAEKSIRGTVADQIKAVVCEELGTLGSTAVSDVIEMVDGMIEQYKKPLGPNLADPLRPEQNLFMPQKFDVVDLTDIENSIGGWFNTALSRADEMLGSMTDDESSPTGTGRDLGVNKILRSTILDESRAFIVPVSSWLTSATNGGVVFQGHDMLTETTVVLKEVRLKGLDTFTLFDPLNTIGKYTLANKFHLDHLSFEADLSIEMLPSSHSSAVIVNPSAGDKPRPQIENITIKSSVRNVVVDLSFFLALNQDGLGDIQLGSILSLAQIPACLLGAIHKAKVSGLSVVVDDIETPQMTGFISPGIDRILRTAADLAFTMYKSPMLDAVPNFFQITVRKIINDFLSSQINSEKNDRTCRQVGWQDTNSGGILDFRDLFLFPDEASKFGGSGNSPYGDVGPMVMRLLDDQVLAVDDDGLSKINNIVFGPMTEVQSNVPGSLLFPGDLFGGASDVNVGGFKATVEVRAFDAAIERVNTVGEPLRLLAPVKDQRGVLDNTATFGVGKNPLRASVGFLISIMGDDDDLSMRNEIVVSADLSTASIMAAALVRMKERSFLTFPLRDMLNFNCWLATMPAANLNEYGVRVAGTKPASLALQEVAVSISRLELNVKCVSCTSPGFEELAQMLSSPEGIDDATMVANRVSNYLTSLLGGELVETKIDRLLFNAEKQCPHHPNAYDPNFVEPTYKAFEAPDRTVAPLNFLVALLIVGSVLLIIVAFVAVVIKCIVRRRHRRWIKTLDEEEIKNIYSQQVRALQIEKDLSISTKSLATSPVVPLVVRIGMPFIIVFNIGLFLSGHLSLGATVTIKASIAGEELIVGEFFKFSMAYSVSEMWAAGAKSLAVLILIFSGVWPYTKQCVTLVLWFLPARWCSTTRRGKIFLWLDCMAKWSMVDIFVLLCTLAAFRISIESPDGLAFLPDDFYSIDLMVIPLWGLYANMLAQLISQISSHFVIYYHRRVVASGSSPLLRLPDSGDDLEAKEDESTKVAADARPLKPLARHSYQVDYHKHGQQGAARPFVSRILIFGAMTVTALMIAGCTLYSFSLDIMGIIGIAVESGQEFAQAKTYHNLFSLAGVIMEQARFLDTGRYYLGLGTLVSILIVTTLLVPIVQVWVLVRQWLAPLSQKGRRRIHVVIECLAAWQYVEVYIVSIVITSWQIGSVSDFMVNAYCSSLIPALSSMAYYGIIDPADAQCFRVEARVEKGVYVLIVAAIFLGLINQFITAAAQQRDEEDTRAYMSRAVSDAHDVGALRLQPQDSLRSSGSSEDAFTDQDEKNPDKSSRIKPVGVRFADTYRFMLQMQGDHNYDGSGERKAESEPSASPQDANISGGNMSPPKTAFLTTQFTDQTTNESREEDVITFAEAKDDDMA